MAAEEKRGISDIERFRFEAIIKNETEANYTPEFLEKRLKQLNISNIDDNKKHLSAAEAEEYLRSFFKDPPVGNELKLMLSIKKNIAVEDCRHASFDDVAGKTSQDSLKIIGEKEANHLTLIKAVAWIMKTPSEEEAIKKEKELITAYSAATSNSGPKTLTEEDSRGIAEFNTTEKIKAIKEIFKNYPKIHESALHMPDLTALGTLDANATCKAVTGKPIGLEM